MSEGMETFVAFMETEEQLRQHTIFTWSKNLPSSFFGSLRKKKILIGASKRKRPERTSETIVCSIGKLCKKYVSRHCALLEWSGAIRQLEFPTAANLFSTRTDNIIRGLTESQKQLNLVEFIMLPKQVSLKLRGKDKQPGSFCWRRIIIAGHIIKGRR